MKSNIQKLGSDTHAASFRISAEQYNDFQELLESVPGSNVGNMYREIFARGLKTLREFYTQQGIIGGTDGADEKKGA